MRHLTSSVVETRRVLLTRADAPAPAPPPGGAVMEAATIARLQDLLEAKFGLASGAWQRDQIARALDSRERALAGATAPAKGLTLVEVHY